jgi:signal transduction histidine kinase/ligand-binding sensor domain-containing protein
MLLRVFTFTILIVLPVLLPAQPTLEGFKSFGRAEGVPGSSNNKIFESADHFLWLSTSSGLYRFDGYQFTPFFANSKDSNSLSSNVISDIEEDRHGNLWVGSFGRGVNRLNKNTGKWQQYIYPTKDSNSFYWIFDLFKDKAGSLWLGTNGRGLLRYEEKSDSFLQFLPDVNKNATGTAPFENEVRAIAGDAVDPGILWLAGTDGLYRFNTKNKKFVCYKNIKNKKALWINNSFHTIYVQDKQNIWLGAWGGGLIHFNTATGAFINYPPAPKEYEKQNVARNIVSNIAYCTDTSLYISTGEGLFEFNITRSKFIKLNKSQGKGENNTAEEFYGVTHTTDGGTWICSPDYIFQKHPVYTRLGVFQTFYQPQEKYVYKPSLSGVLYNRESKQYWMSCNAGFGVYIYDSVFNYIKSVAIENFEADRRLREIVQDASGTIWLRSKDFPYLYYYNKIKDRFLNAATKFKDATFINDALQEMAIDGKGNVWFARKDQLLKWDVLQQKMQVISLTGAPKSTGLLLWMKIRFDNNDDPWICTNAGLYHYTQSNARWEYLYATKNNSQSLASNAIVNIAFDKSGHSWIAPKDEGMQLYNLSAKKFIQHYIQAEGFIAQRIHDMVTAVNGDLWAATVNGLTRYDAHNSKWYSFNQEDGLPPGYLDRLFATDDGTMILSAQNGFTHWNTHSMPVNKQKPIVYFNRFVSGGKNPELANNSIYLPYTGNELSIEFSAIATVMGSRTSFYYKILPLQKEWTATTQRSISLAGFAPGKYKILIKAINSDAIESEIKEFQLFVAYPLWKKWWFILLSVLALAGLLYWLYRYRLKQVLKIQQMKNNISRDLHDEIGSSVSSVNILSMVAKKQLGEEHPVAPLLTQIGLSAQNAGDGINEIIWSINPQNDSMERIVLRMKELTAEMLEFNNIDYTLNFDNELNRINIPVQHRRHLLLIYKEALNNMIKYSGCKNALLSIQIREPVLLMKIEDDGIGFDILNYKPGNGLINMQERAKEMKAALSINTTAGKGCSILLDYRIK